MVWPSGVTPGDPGVARGHHDVGGAARGPGPGRAPARPSRRRRPCARSGVPGVTRGAAHAAKRTNCSRPGPTPTRRTGDADLLGQEVHVVAGRLGQVAELGGPRDVGLPPGQLLVDRGDLVEDRLVVGRVGEPLAVGLVGHAHLDRVEGVEHVELGQGHLGQRVEPDRLAHHDGVEPAGAAAAPGVDPVLVAPVDQGVADLVGQLGRERTAAHPGHVGLGDADDLVDVAGADARPRCRPRRPPGWTRSRRDRCRGRGRGRWPGPPRAGRGRPGRGRRGAGPPCRPPSGRPAGPARRGSGRRSRRPTAGSRLYTLARIGVLLLQHHVELLAEDLGVEEVLDPQAHPRGLVGVGRADAPLGGAQLVLAQVALGQPVELVVVGHDQVGVAADQQPRRCRCPWPARVSTSASRTVGSTTTPLPMIGVMWS